ncbi:hypothetical protein QFC22_006169 [Naganishia vaughanmartiniae]|uniref:Uncharacterized protein n=1 Tax=Naganishia vaughanmartiniae TaxID=1424756 RepID=A0ACC2WQ58_9TREE|nr:hypothetical protein QFC22_006169 [Naganishia vaughanmartiniae]
MFSSSTPPSISPLHPTTPPIPAPTLETLPLELISQILSYLPLSSLLPLSTLSRTFQFISSDPTVTPFPTAIAREIDLGPPYTRELEVLGTYSHIPRGAFIQVLVRAAPEWVLDNMVIPVGMTTLEWRECFEQRFLPSWKRFKFRNHTSSSNGEHSWRAAFLRVLRTLVHRQLGCTHQEAWTRFLILHRNGSASLNRIYSRTFDPLEIYAEIRRQNALLGPQFRQEARLVCQFQDFRVMMLGSVADPGKSLFVNPNAYTLLHPPGVEEVVLDDGRGGEGEGGTVWARMDPVLPQTSSQMNTTTPTAVPDQPPSNGNALQQQQSPPPPVTRGTSSSLTTLVNKLRVGAGKSSSSPSSSISRDNGATSGGDSGADPNAINRPGAANRRRSSFLSRTLSRETPSTANPLITGTTEPNAAHGARTPAGGVLSLVRTRTGTGDTGTLTNGAGGREREMEQDVAGTGGGANGPGGGGLRRRLSLLTRSRSRDAPAHIQQHAGVSEEHAVAVDQMSPSEAGQAAPTLPDLVNSDNQPGAGAGNTVTTLHPTISIDLAARDHVPEHANQHTVSFETPVVSAQDPSEEMLPYPLLTHPLPAQSHALYPNYTPFDLRGGGGGPGVRDTRQGRLVAPSPPRKYLPMSVPVGAEWEEGQGWKTWVGPVLLFAQLSSAAHASNDAQGGEILDGPIPPFDFGPRGMYASFDWEDLDALAPWLELQEVENGNDGTGVDVAAGNGAGQGANRSAGVHRAGLGFAR